MFFCFRDLKKISLSLELAMTWIRVERFHEEMDYIWQKIVEEYKKFSAKTPSVCSKVLCYLCRQGEEVERSVVFIRSQ